MTTTEYSPEALNILVQELLGDENLTGEVDLTDIKDALQVLYDRGWRLIKKLEYRPSRMWPE